MKNNPALRFLLCFLPLFTISCSSLNSPIAETSENLPHGLDGSHYYLIQLDSNSFQKIQDKVIQDYRPDNIPYSKKLYVWDDTFRKNDSQGLNSFGQEQNWVSMEVTGIANWSGAGFNLDAKFGYLDMTALFKSPEDYVFRVALKSSQPNTSYQLIFTDMVNEAKITIGPATSSNPEPYTDFERDGKWHEIVIPVSHLQSLGVTFQKPFAFPNVLAFQAGGIEGTTLDLDAAFFYKPAKN